jgi:hypothetical protein
MAATMRVPSVWFAFVNSTIASPPRPTGPSPGKIAG